MRADVGKNAALTLGENEDAESLRVEADSASSARVIAGSISGSSAKAGVGATVAVAERRDSVRAGVGEASAVTATGDVAIQAAAQNDIWAVTTADAVATGAGGAAIGGGVNVILTGTSAQATLGDHALVDTDGAFALTAQNDAKLTLISADVGLGTGAAVAAGGTVAVLVNENSTVAEAGRESAVTARDVRIEAASSDALLNILASASGAGTSSATAAGTIGVAITTSQTRAEALEGSSLTAENGHVRIHAKNDAQFISGMLAATAGNAAAALGASVSTHLFEQSVIARAGDRAALTAKTGNVSLSALANNRSFDVAVAGAATLGTAALTGTALTTVSRTEATAELGQAVTVRADDSVGVVADASGTLASVGGAGTVSAGAIGAGATVNTVIVENAVTAQVGDLADLIGLAAASMPSISGVSQAGIAIPNRAERRRGVAVYAGGDFKLYMGAASGALAIGTASVTGVVSTAVVQNRIRAQVGNGVRINASSAGGASAAEGAFTQAEGSGDAQEASVDAEGETQLYHFAGGLNIGNAAGVGATVVVQVLKNSVQAGIGDDGAAFASGDVRVAAQSRAQVALAGLAFGIAGTAAVSPGANALVFEDTVSAAAGGRITAGGKIEVTALGDTELYNIGAALAGAGNAAVSPIAIVTYFNGASEATVGASAALEAAGAVKVAADSKQNVVTAANGVSAAAVAAVSGTVSVTVSKRQTRASALDGATLRGASVDVTATDLYDFFGEAATIGASGTAAVGVTAMVNVLKNSVEASLGRNSIVYALTGDANIAAKAERDVASYAGSVSGSGTAAVGATVMVTVIGDKLQQDARDALLMQYDANGGRTSGGLDIDALMDTFASGNAAAHEALQGMTLSEDLAGDGQSAADLQVGDKDGVDVTGGYVSEEFATATGDKTAGEGENHTFTSEQNADLNAAAALGQAARGYDPMSSTGAFVGAGSSVFAAGDIRVTADQLLTADMITGTLGVAGVAGVGAGVAVAVTYADVAALVGENATLEAGGDVVVEATSASAEQDQQTEQAQSVTEGLVKELGENLATYGVRALSVTAGGGYVGVSVSAAVIALDDALRAELMGSVLSAQNVSIRAGMRHENVLAATLAASGGFVAVSVPVSLVRAQGTVRTGISGAGSVACAGAVSVTTDILFKNLSAAAAFGGGAVSANAALPLSISGVTGDTFIARGVSVEAKTVDVAANSLTSARAALLGVNGGAVAAGAGVAIAIDKTSLATYIGADPRTNAASGSAGTVSATGDVRVRNTIASLAEPTIFAANAGAVAASINVLLAFNQSDAVASIAGMNVASGGNIAVEGMLSDAVARADLYRAGAGAITAGVSVAYAQMRAINAAKLDGTGVTVRADGDINVYAGTQAAPGKALAEASAMSGDVGAIAGAVNVAIADNDTRNEAKLLGAASADNVFVEAWLQSGAPASLHGLNIGAISVGVGTLVSVDRAQNLAVIENGDLRANSLQVIAQADSLDGENVASVELVQGAGTLVGAGVNVAVAYARVENTASANLINLELSGDLRVLAEGSANAEASIVNGPNIHGVAIGVMTGYAYAQGAYAARLTLPAGGNARTDGIEVSANVRANANAVVEPSLGGVELGAAAVKVNIAIASVSTEVTAAIARAGEGTLPVLNAAGGVVVRAELNAGADANVTTAKLVFETVNIAVNVSSAKLSGTQKALVENVQLTAPSLTVTSLLNQNGGTGAQALVGASGGANVTLQLGGVAANTATARNAQESAARVFASMLNIAGDLAIETLGKVRAVADVESGTTVTLLNVALMQTIARAEAGLSAQLELGGATVKAGTLTVRVSYNDEATARVAPGGSAADVSLGSLTANTATADADTAAQAGIGGNGALTVAGKAAVSAIGAGGATAEGRTVKVDVTALRITVNTAVANAAGLLDARITGNAVYDLGSLEVLSQYKGEGAKATVGGLAMGGGASVSLLGNVNTNVANAAANIQTSAAIRGGMTITARDGLSVQAVSAGKASAEALASSVNVNLLGIGNLHADGTVRGSTTAELTARQVDVLAGDAVVSAKDTPSLHVLSQLPGVSVSVISVNVATAEGRIGEENSTQRNSVRAQVGDGTTLNVHDGDFSLLAANEPAKNEIVIDNGLNVGLVNVTVSCAGTETYLETAATVGKGANIKAVGAYTQLAQDKPNAATRASGSSIGIGISADNYFAENIAVSAVRATVGEGANIQALNGIRVEAVSDAVLSAITDADQGGVFTEGVLKSRNAVERELRTELGRDVTLYTLGGDIHVRVTSGQHDSITTRTLDSAAQLIGISDVRANTTITTKQYIDLYPGLHVENLTGDVYIVATAGADKIDNYSENRTSAAYASQTGKAETTLDLTTHIVFNDEGTEPEQFVFIGRDLWFLNWLNEIDVKNELYISNAGFSGSIYPTNTVLIDLDMLLDVWYGKTVANGGIRYLNMGYHEDYNAPGSMRFDNHARLDLPLLSLSALRAMIEGGNQNTVVSFEGSLHTYTHKTRNLFTVGDDCETLTGFLGEESSGMLRRSDIEYTLLGSDSFKYSVFNSFDDGVNNSLIHDYADFPWLGIPQMLEEEGPVIVDITDDGVTVTGDTDGIIRAAYDATAGAWVFEPIVKDIYEGMIIESFLPEDIIIVNRSRSDLILQGIAFAGDVMGSSSVKIVSGRDTDLYIWGDIAQRIDHPDAPDGHYSLYEQVTWWGPEGGRLYQGRKNDISITIDGDGRYTRAGEGSESIEISASPDAYTLKNILQNAANVVSIRGQMTLENCLEHVIYNGGHVTITNNTAKDLIFEGAGFGGGSFVQYIGKNHYQVITEPSDSSFRVINNAGGDSALARRRDHQALRGRLERRFRRFHPAGGHDHPRRPHRHPQRRQHRNGSGETQRLRAAGRRRGPRSLRQHLGDAGAARLRLRGRAHGRHRNGGRCEHRVYQRLPELRLFAGCDLRAPRGPQHHPLAGSLPVAHRRAGRRGGGDRRRKRPFHLPQRNLRAHHHRHAGRPARHLRGRQVPRRRLRRGRQHTRRGLQVLPRSAGRRPRRHAHEHEAVDAGHAALHQRAKWQPHHRRHRRQWRHTARQRRYDHRQRLPRRPDRVLRRLGRRRPAHRQHHA